MVNRVWAHYFGRGLVNPPDDLNLANPPSHPQLMDWLAGQFIESGYDLKWLHRTILNSQAYQRSSATTPQNARDERNYSHAKIRRLPAEVAIDPILQATASDAVAKTWTQKTTQRKIAQHPRSFQARGIDYSLLIFGKPLRTTNCDCERQAQPTLIQAIYRRNDQELLGWLERPDGWLMQMAKELDESLRIESKAASTVTVKRSDVEREQLEAFIVQAYRRTLSRSPNSDEMETSLQHLSSAENHVEGLRDLMWALLNSREFITNH